MGRCERDRVVQIREERGRGEREEKVVDRERQTRERSAEIVWTQSDCPERRKHASE